jgi:hypothetical protein
VICDDDAARFSEIVSRVNGVSCPIFGVSWDPARADVEVARKVVTFVETRRVLFSTYTNEVPEHCVQSVLEIRAFLTDVLGEGRIGDELSGPLRLMRRYCVSFLDRVGASDVPGARNRRLFHEPHWGMHDYWFGEALGELRSAVGLQIAVIAAAFGLDVEDDLARVLPASDPPDIMS